MTDVITSIWNRIYELEERVNEMMEDIKALDVAVKKMPKVPEATVGEVSCICAEKVLEAQGIDWITDAIHFICPVHGLKTLNVKDMKPTQQGGETDEDK